MTTTSGVEFDKPEADIALEDSGASRDGAGSNNWAVSPARTATGRPILANDPHRGHGVPSLRYIAHLAAPGLNVIGAGEPALPGISIGHNKRVAFGLTIFALDQEDLYVYEMHPEDPGSYRYRGDWLPFETVGETIEIRDAPDLEATIKFTRHGPVVFEDPEEHRAFAVRAGWLEPGMAPYFGSVEYMRAQNWREFVAALNRWGAPAENQVYADIDGNIGYKPAGLVRVLAPEDAAPLLEYADPVQALAYLQNQSAERDAFLAQTLAQALTTMESRLGTDSTQWKWGALHQVAFAHPLAHRAQGDLLARMTLPSYPRGGRGAHGRADRSSARPGA